VYVVFLIQNLITHKYHKQTQIKNNEKSN